MNFHCNYMCTNTSTVIQIQIKSITRERKRSRITCMWGWGEGGGKKKSFFDLFILLIHRLTATFKKLGKMK